MKNRLQRQRGKKRAADTPGQQLCPPSQTNCSGSAPRFCHEMILRPCTSKTAHPRNVYLSPSTLNAVSRNGGNIPDPFRTRETTPPDAERHIFVNTVRSRTGVSQLHDAVGSDYAARASATQPTCEMRSLDSAPFFAPQCLNARSSPQSRLCIYS